jgi:methyl-accepting chemotaxis protein
MRKLTLKMKLGVGFGTLLVIVAVVGGLGYYSTYRLSDATDRIVLNGETQNFSMEMVAALEMQTTAIRGFLLAGKEELLKHDQEGQEAFKENAAKLEPLLQTERGKRVFADISRLFREYRTVADRQIQLRREGKTKEATDLAFAAHTTQLRTDLSQQL